jgi:hypothetical protein
VLENAAITEFIGGYSDYAAKAGIQIHADGQKTA